MIIGMAVGVEGSEINSRRLHARCAHHFAGRGAVMICRLKCAGKGDLSAAGAGEASRLAEVKRMEDRLAMLEAKHQRREKVKRAHAHKHKRRNAQALQQCSGQLIM